MTRTTPSYETREIETIGRYQCITSVYATVYPHTIIATGDAEHITQHQMKKMLDREFPRHTFVFNLYGRDCLRADADRWTGDGV